ncbi:MAG: hypothetical protein K2X87_15815 [Gemmataceae bacterium]|nr:hypothetical protein [Gemmataceae bacterium]
MDPFCPACRSVFLGTSSCPRCGGELRSSPERPAARPPGTTPAGRVAVGSLAAVGLAVGLGELTAGWTALADGTPGPWAGQGGRAAAVLFGGLLAGVGLRRGFPAGAAVGGLSGGAFFLLDGSPANPALYALPALAALLGGLAGMVGAWVWAAPVPVALPAPEPSPRRSSIRLAVDPPAGRGPAVAWLRVAAGAAVIAAGVGLADETRAKAQRYSGGLLRVDNRGQGRLLSLQLAVLAGLVGGVVAAAGTGAGVRHGGLAGAVAAAGVVGMALSRGELPVPAAVALDRLGVAVGPDDPAALGVVAAGVVGLGLIGGWFGGVLFPPLAPRSMRDRKVRLGGD